MDVADPAVVVFVVTAAVTVAHMPVLAGLTGPSVLVHVLIVVNVLAVIITVAIMVTVMAARHAGVIVGIAVDVKMNVRAVWAVVRVSLFR